MIATTIAIKPKLIRETPIVSPCIKYSSFKPGNPARRTTNDHAIDAMNLYERFPHIRPVAQIPRPVAISESIKPIGG